VIDRKSWFLAAVVSLFVAANAGAVPAESKKLEPLTFKNVSAFFSETLKIRPTEIQKRCVIFYAGEWRNSNDYNYCVIIVENSDADVQVTFYLTDDREMNWVNEFLDGPFFTKSETETLFGLLYQGRTARAERVGRFRVDVSDWKPRHAQILVFSFTASQ
jgi:hypothetical protein